MFIISANGQRALRQVHVAIDSDESPTDEQVIAFAMRSQNEDKSSLFGWEIKRYGSGAVVDLWRD